MWTASVLILSLLLCGTAAAADIQDPHITPGAVREGLSKATICNTKWGKDARHVTQKMKHEAFASYGFSGNEDPRCVPAGKRRCEIDHLVSRELGGADDIKNLWPEPYGTTPWNAVKKDKLENRLHKEMCAGHISLKAARAMLVNDWRKAYVRWYWVP